MWMPWIPVLTPEKILSLSSVQGPCKEQPERRLHYVARVILEIKDF